MKKSNNSLEESKFIATNGEVNLFFSSSARLGRFLVGYMEQREKALKRMKLLINETSFPYELLSDIEFYKHCEIKGCVWTLNNVKLTDEQIEQYIISLISDKKVLDYRVVSDPKEVSVILSRIEL